MSSVDTRIVRDININLVFKRILRNRISA